MRKGWVRVRCVEANQIDREKSANTSAQLESSESFTPGSAHIFDNAPPAFVVPPMVLLGRISLGKPWLQLPTGHLFLDLHSTCAVRAVMLDGSIMRSHCARSSSAEGFSKLCFLVPQWSAACIVSIFELESNLGRCSGIFQRSTRNMRATTDGYSAGRPIDDARHLPCRLLYVSCPKFNESFTGARNRWDEQALWPG